MAGHTPDEGAGLKTLVYRWGNNARRRELKGRPCTVVARGSMGTVLLRFTDTGELVTTSWRAAW